MINLTMYSDGGSRGNPGPAACGVVIFGQNQDELHRIAKTIGVTTNNQAEYQALVMGLEWALSEYGQAEVLCRLDSELVVKQLKGEYKMKNAELRPWYDKIILLQAQLGGKITFQHVPREQNKIADKLVNQALDGQI
ncbi:MAG: ribonuclease HI family protein [Patescibacteria group bacterium]